MPGLNGACYCGNITLIAEHSLLSSAISPRACDCDFCTKHGAAWFSDPRGRLDIHVRDGAQLRRVRQGSGQAECLLCTQCGVVAAVTYSEGDATWGALNYRSFLPQAAFAPCQSASPKLLAPDQKAERWKSLWFPRVRLTQG